MSLTTNKNNKNIVARRTSVLVLLSVALLFVLLVTLREALTLGWFSENKAVEANGAELSIAEDLYEIVIARTTEYDSLLNGDPKYDGVSELKTLLSSSHYGYDMTETSTLNADRLGYELRNEVTTSKDGVVYRSLTPGSCGTLTFYIRLKTPEHIITTLKLERGCFTNIYVNDVLTLTEVTSETVSDLLRGHILFFTDRTGTGPNDYKYNGLIGEEGLTYNTSLNSTCSDPGFTDCYKITLYWEWPMTYYDISDNISSTAWEKRFPAELEDFLEDNRECFFATNINSSVPDELYDGYNDGDQIIGENASHIVAYIIPDR